MTGIESLEQTITRFERVRDEALTADELLRERIREAHAATKDARLATKELRAEWKSAKDEIAAKFSQLATDAVKHEMTDVAKQLGVIRDQFFARVDSAFRRLESKVFTAGDPTKRDLRDLIDDGLPPPVVPPPSTVKRGIAETNRDLDDQIHRDLHPRGT